MSPFVFDGLWCCGLISSVTQHIRILHRVRVVSQPINIHCFRTLFNSKN